jgi:hypothetical protein
MLNKRFIQLDSKPRFRSLNLNEIGDQGHAVPQPKARNIAKDGGIRMEEGG